MSRLLVTVALVAGCAGSSSPPTSGSPRASAASLGGSPSVSADPSEPASDSTSDSTPASTPSAQSEVEPAPSSVDGTEQAPGGAAALGLVGIRIGAEDGFERIVLDLAGEGEPGWFASYTDDPRTDGEGKPVELEGAASLRVIVSGVGYGFDTGVPDYDGPDDILPSDTTVVREVRYFPTFEGQALLLVGVDGERAFRVTRLTGPTRLVIDVATG